MSADVQDGNAHSMEETEQCDGEKVPTVNSEMIPLDTVSPSPEPPPPPSARDRGYAWVIVVAVFGINTLCAGYIKSFGITYLLLMQRFPDASSAAGGWIMGLLVGTRGLLSPFMGALAVKVGPRRCVFAGTILAITGLMLAIPLLNIYYMAVTVGCLVGLGIAMSETPGYILVTDYFVEKRTAANGIRAAGNPMGGILFSPLVVFFSEQYGLQGTFILLAGVMLHMLILGTLMRPFELQEQILHQEQFRKTMKGVESARRIDKNQFKKKPPPRKALDLTLFKNPRYLLYLVMAVSVNLALPNFLLYIPAYGESVGLTNYQLPVITSYQAGTDCAFRFLCGYIVQKFKLNEATVFIVGLLVGGVGCMFVTLCSNMWQLILATTLFSFGIATFWALLHTLLAKHFGTESIASSWGFFRMSQGISSFIFPSLLGWIKDITGSLVIPFLVMGSGFIVGGLLFSFNLVIERIATKRNTQV